MNVTVVGAGSWGTAIAALIAATRPVTLWARRTELAHTINAERQNPDYLPGVNLPNTLTATTDLAAAISDIDLLVIGVPSHGYRAVLAKAAGVVDPSTPILSLAKGIEQSTLMRMTEVTADILPGHDTDKIGVLTGPNLAKEIAAGQPTATVIAMRDDFTARQLQTVFMTPTFRVYTNRDVIGSEAAGALKNVMAIAAGMGHGLGFGDNSTATLITRALAELTRLGVKMGGSPLTFTGLAGMGDLIATCMSSQSRNHRVGYSLGKGQNLKDIISEMNMVAEGVKSTRGVLALAAKHSVEMPIAQQVGRVLYNGISPRQAVESLMGREPRAET